MTFFKLRKKLLLFGCGLLICITLALIMCIQLADLPPDLSHIEGTECPDEAILEHIEKDFAEYANRISNGRKVEEGRFRVIRCYGTYDGCVPIMLSGFVHHCALWDSEIAGSVIHYGNGNYIRVWKNGDFLALDEAYAAGWLTAEQIAIIADVHNNGRYLKRIYP